MRTVGLFLLILLGFPDAASGSTLWTGTTAVTTASAECSANAAANKPVVAGVSYYTVFRPGGVTGNPSYSYAALYDEDRSVFGMAAGNGIPANTYLYDGVRLSSQRYGTVGNLQSGELISFQVSPATITANSRRITAVASLFTSFMGIPGCAVTLKVSVVR